MMNKNDWIKLTVSHSERKIYNKSNQIVDLEIRIDRASNIPRDINLLYSFTAFLGELRKHNFSCEVTEAGDRE